MMDVVFTQDLSLWMVCLT